MRSSKRMGVILCGCKGNISNTINLSRVADCLRVLDEVEVETVDDLCNDLKIYKVKEMAKRVSGLVIAGCTDEDCVSRFRGIVDETELPYFSYDFVNLKQECAKIIPPSEVDKYAQLAVQACIEKLRTGLDIAKKAIPLQKDDVFTSKQSMTRRQFFKLPLKFVEYEEIPVLDNEMCIANRSMCRICIDQCPSGALFLDEDDDIHLNGEVCQKCGLCSIVCPLNCFEMPTFSNSQMTAMLSALASPETQLDDHRLIFTCDKGRKQIDNWIDGGWKMPAAFTIRVPCLASISPLALLWVMELGFDASVCFCLQDDCCKKMALEKWEDMFCSLQELSSSLENPLHWKLVKCSEEYVCNAVDEAFQEFTGKNKINSNPVSLDSNRRDGLLTLLGSLLKDEKASLSINHSCLPFYHLQIDEDKCSMCGVCVRNCPSEALVMTEGEESTLQFLHYNCLGCSTCVAKCPEEAIKLKRIMDLPKLLDRTFQVMYRDDIVRCLVCNRPIGKKSTLQNVECKLKEKGLDNALEQLYRCETCKVLDGFEQI